MALVNKGAQSIGRDPVLPTQYAETRQNPPRITYLSPADQLASPIFFFFNTKKKKSKRTSSSFSGRPLKPPHGSCLSAKKWQSLSGSCTGLSFGPINAVGNFCAFRKSSSAATQQKTAGSPINTNARDRQSQEVRKNAYFALRAIRRPATRRSRRRRSASRR